MTFLKTIRPYLINIAVLVLAFMLSIGVGAMDIPPRLLLRMLLAQLPGLAIASDWPQAFALVLFQIRLPHTLLILLTGAALASSGAVYQGLFRNPLADPYLIGVASGAGLGAVFGMTLPMAAGAYGLYTIPALAFVGACLTVALVYLLARVGGTVPMATLILAGVAVSAFATSLTSYLMLHSNQELRRAITWILGGTLMSGWQPVAAMFPYAMAGMIILAFSGHTLNVLQFGDEQAQQLGIPVERRKLLLILAASLTAAAAISFAGIIGFLGLIVPHLVRILWGPDYRRLVPLSMLAGASALLLADVLARWVLAPEVLPVGVITALAGAPFFLWVLRSVKQQNYW
jgi:iron complex transport system permease protein